MTSVRFLLVFVVLGLGGGSLAGALHMREQRTEALNCNAKGGSPVELNYRIVCLKKDALL